MILVALDLRFHSCENGKTLIKTRTWKSQAGEMALPLTVRLPANTSRDWKNHR